MRVLVVDDERPLAEMLRRGLTDGGCVVEVVHDGQDALWAATQKRFDAVVLDLMLPRGNGYQVIRELRRRQVWTPVLMLTAKDGEYDEADAFDLGVDDYLTKPFSVVVLLARLRALVRRGAPARPVVLRCGDLALDPTRRRVERAGRPIETTPREFGLLAFLMRHRGDVVTRAQILDGVWDPAFDGDPNVVEVYVGYLRRKIDVPFGRHSIETVRGVGYRLSAGGG